MPLENTQTITLTAATGADVRTRRFVTQGAGGVAESADGADSIGVNMTFYDDSEHTNDGASRAVAVVVNRGARVELEAGEAVAVGDAVASDSQGRAKTSATGDAILGVAVSASSAAGEVVDMIFAPAGRQTA